MNNVHVAMHTHYELDFPSGIDAIVRALNAKDYNVIGPTVRDRTVVLAKIRRAEDLPVGYGDEQEKGTYKLTNKADGGYFGYNLGPTSWKSFLFPERRQLWKLKRNSNPEVIPTPSQPLAFVGVRACELAAIGVQDRVFLRDKGDPEYQKRRESLFIVGVHCRTSAPTCFCPSMGTGPEFNAAGWDLLLTEDNNRFFIETATAKGLELLSSLPIHPAPANTEKLISEQLEATKKSITREMPQNDIKETIYENIQSSRWDAIASRCLSCANCTMVCPTCFCSTVEDVSDVENATAERWQKWDSCFHIDFSYVHGGSRRVSTASRYRQWFTHKLATWHDQFGTSGCVGCGRCIAWCPVGIDITEEMTSMRTDAQKSRKESNNAK